MAKDRQQEICVAKTTWKYLPILKWKRGEQDAFRHLSATQRDGIIPLIEPQPEPGVTVATLVEIARSQIDRCVAVEAVAVETLYLFQGRPKPVDLLASYCDQLQAVLDEHRIIPVIHGALVESLENSSTQSKQLLKKFPEVVVRLRSDLIEPDQVGPSIELVRDIGIKSSAIHILIDQYSLVGGDPVAGAARVGPYLAAALALNCASVTVSGGSFPINLMGYKQGAYDIARVEWQIWMQLQKSGQFPDVLYSDYTVTNPSPLEEMDPRQVNPSISIRYAATDIWRLFKGGGFKKGKPGTLKALCQLLTSDTVYSGPTYSFGDASYDASSKSASVKNGIPWTWRRDATSHHMVLTADAL